MEPAEVLDHLRVYVGSNIYQLGCTASTLNVSAQQQRAFNLVWALQTRDGLENKHVAIIGGGIAGITAATAAAAAGAFVWLYEKKGSLMHLQAGNQTRFLHPSIALWPKRSFGYPLTSMPFLNWRAETAGNVVAQLLRQWLAQRKALGRRIELRLGCSVKEVLIDPTNQNKAIVKRNRGRDSYDIVIIAA
jgi:cation diffusion facilitator CzcD-associated flavoprotein CzcO